MKPKYFRRILIAIDQLFNTVFGGHPDETISSRLGKKARRGSLWARVACWLIGKVFFHNTRHCSEAIEGDEGEVLWNAYKTSSDWAVAIEEDEGERAQ